MKKLLLLISVLFFCTGLFAQTIPYNDDFESYSTGSFLASQNPTWWTTWSNLPGSAEDAIISNAFANSPTKSVKVETSTDLILKLGNKTTGKYDLHWKMYVETGKAGYYNVQHMQSPGIEYAYEVYFLANGTGRLYAGSTTYFTFTYPKDTWFEVKNAIDVDADLVKLYVNGVLVQQWPFHYVSDGTTGTNQLGGVDFYAGAVTGETPKYFFDDLVYQYEPTVLYSNGFDTYALDSYVAVNDPVWFTTWSNAPGGPEDSKVKNTFSYSPANSALVDGSTDLILKLGNKTTGVYDLRWWMYLETGKGGYYNIQHFQSPGTEFACEIYFLAAGGGTLKAGNVTYNFTHPKNTWFEVKNLIDLDADIIKMYVNGVLVHEWPFHYQAGSTTGTKQLGGIDFYAGAATGETPKYYFDDVSYLQMGAPSDPIIGVNPASIADTLSIAQTQIHQLTVSNTGPSSLVYSVNVILNSDGMNLNQPPQVIAHPVSTSASLNLCSSVSTSGQTSPPPISDAPGATAILHYDTINSSAIGWNSPPITVTVAAMFPNAITLPYAGMMLESVDVYINDTNATGGNVMTVKIYGMGTSYEPGTLLTSQTFNPVGDSWNHIVLTSPVLVTGQDLWIGYSFTQITAGIFIPGTDAGPNNPNGDFLSTGVGWSHLSNNPALPYNWNIRGNLNGTPFPQWLTVSPMGGTVAPNGNIVHDVTLNSTGLTPGIYNGIIRITSNDPVTPQVDVPVELTVVGQICDPPTSVAVSNVTSNSASVSWAGAPWVEIDYGPAGHTAGTGTIIQLVNTNPYPLTGLTPYTAYTVFVRQDCSAGNYSPWVGPVAFSTSDALSATLYPFNLTNGTGYVSNATYTKNGPWLSCSSSLNDTVGRGYMKFDVSSLPLNAVITKATLNYYNFYRYLTSTAVNSIYPLSVDPMTAGGTALHTDCGDGPVLWSGVWGGTAPLWYNSPLNASGLNYIMDQLQSGWAGFGLPRTSTAIFRFAGYNDATYKPFLQVEYHLLTAPTFSLTPASASFEPVNLGLQSLPQSFTIKNAGSGTITISSVFIEGTNADQFILTDGATYPKVLGAGVSYTVKVVCKPTSTGTKTANLKVTDMDENEYSATLAGTGYLNGPQNLTADPVIGPYVDLAWEAPLPLHEIRYDDNSVETFYWLSSPTTTLQRFSEKITIPSDGILQTIGVFCRSNTLLNWTSISLCTDNGGIPNLAAPVESFPNVAVTSATGQWILLNLATPLSVTTGQTYYIVTQWPAGSTTGPFVGTDTHSNKMRSTYTSNGGASWSAFPYNLIMRAYMTPIGDNSAIEPIILTSGAEVSGMETLPVLTAEMEPKAGIEPLSFIAPAIVAPSNPNRTLSNYSLHRGTASGVYDLNITGLSGTTYQDMTTAPTTTYYYMLSAVYSNGTANSNEVSVTTFEVCPVPTLLDANGITYTSADLSWNGNGTTAWEIEYGPSGFVQGTGTTIFNVTSNPYTLGGLSNGTAYAYYVRSKCSESSFSSWAGPFAFSTLCPIYPAPFTEDFEQTAFPPICWTRSTGAQLWERRTTASGYGIGTASARAYFYNYPGGSTFHLMSLNFDASALYMPLLKFDFAYATYSGELDSLKLYYSTDNGLSYNLLVGLQGGVSGILNTGGINDSTSFIPLPDQWDTYTIALPAGTNMVRFTGVSAYGNNLYIDNVKVVGTILPLALSAQVTDVSCPDACNGAIDLTVTGGQPPYSYLWSEGSTIQDLNGICAANYFVTVTDNVGAIAYGNWVVASPAPLDLNEVIVPESCPDAMDGSISLSVSGGTPPYNYIWSNGATGTGITGLDAGLYSVTVTDGNMCVLVQNWEVPLTATVCPEISVAADVYDTRCYNATQIIYVAGTAGAFNVYSGGSATFIAGQRIFYYPGTKVNLNGYMHGYIVGPSGPWCTAPSIPANSTGMEETALTTGNAYFSIYPNPTNGNFTLVQTAEKMYNLVKVEIFGMNGERMISSSMIGEKQHEFKTADLPSGLYFVKVVAENYVETIKLVKTR